MATTQRKKPVAAKKKPVAPKKKAAPAAKKTPAAPKKVVLPRLAAGWWEAEAAELSSSAFAQRVPLHVMFGESTDLVSYSVKYWWPEVDGRTKKERRPGLSSAGKKYSLRTVAELRDLTGVCQRLQSEYLITVDGPKLGPLKARGQFLAGEIRAALDFLFDDGVEDENDERLAAVIAAHKDDGESAEVLAAELHDYVALAGPHRAELDGVGNFDAALIDEAAEVAKDLLAHPSRTGPSEAAEESIGRRNRALQLLQKRMNLARSAARFVFRQHAPIARLALSAWERRRRQLRKGKKGEGTPADKKPGEK